MADDIIITEFGADLSKFNTEVDKAAKAIDALDAEMQGASKTGKDLSGNMGDAGKKVALLGSDSKKASKEVATLATEASKSGGFFTNIGAKAKAAFSSVVDGASKLGGNLKSSIGGALQSAGTSISSFGFSALAALGPIGIAIGVIGGLLVKVFANTDAGATYFDGLQRSGTIAFDKITGSITKFYDTLSDGQSTIGQVFGFLGDAIDVVTPPLRGLISVIGELSGISEILSEANKEGQELANAYDAIDEAQYKNIVSNAELEKQVSSLNIKLRDRTLTQAEALKIAGELSETEKKRAAAEIKILEQITAAKQKEADNEKKNKGEVSDATARALEEALAAQIKAAQDSENLQEQAAVRVNLINERASNQSDAIRAKNKAADEKAAQEAIKLANELAAAKLKAAEVQAAPQEEARRATLSPEQVKVDDLSILYAKQVKDAEAAFAQLRKLKEGDAEAIAQIDQEMADNALAIEANKNAALATLRDETLQQIRDVSATKEQLEADGINKRFDALESAARATITNEEDLTAALVALAKEREEQLGEVGADKLQSIQDALKSEEQLEIDAVNKKFDLLDQAAKDVITNEEDLTDVLIELQKRRVDELAGISKDAAEAETELIIQRAQEALNAAQDLGNAIIQINQQNTDSKLEEFDRQIEAEKAYGNDTSALEARRAEEEKKNARKAYQIQKAFALAQIAVDTAKAIASLTAASAANPNNPYTFGAAGALQFAAGIISILANIAQATALLTSKAPALYKGDPYIDGTPDFSGRDGYVRRLDKGERVVTAKDNLEHWDLFEAVRKGKLQEWKDRNMDPIALNFERLNKIPSTAELIAYNFAPMVNNYVEGNANAITLTMPKGHDKGMIKASRESTREQRRTNDILESIANRRTSTPSKRIW